MKKKILVLIFILAVIAVAGGSYYFWLNQKDNDGCSKNQGYTWCVYNNQCVKKENECRATIDWILGEAKKVIGLDLNVMVQPTQYNVGGEQSTLNAKGIYYADAMKAVKALQGFVDLDNFFKNNGFKIDEQNPVVSNDGQDLKVYRKDKILCQLSRTDKAASSMTSLSVFCANDDDKMCDFSTTCGRQCQQDSDCGILLDACGRKTVCRNTSFNFFNNCSNPSAVINDIDFSIQHCLCVSNQCVPQNEKIRDRN